MTREEKLKLYWEAKEAYYNGEEIMTDIEFDALEKELGLENKAAVGSRHNPSYTVKHPFIMGSLSKVQIHKDDDGDIDWKKYFDEAIKYFGHKSLIITPKFDGCSFEVESNNGKLLRISSRGDGEYGKDLTQHLQGKVPEILYSEDNLHRIYRGEVLVKKSVFEQKYAEEFTNPRSFVSGVLNTDYSEDEEFQSRLTDLDIVIYDLREDFGEGWHDQDWTTIKFNTTNRINKYDILPKFSIENTTIDTAEDLEAIYYAFDKYRKECEYALDGIVIKPISKERINNMTEHRPKDCVAIKFVPMLEETEVIDITWNLGKTTELTPIVWVKPVEMDGRMVGKCSGHNYGYLLKNKVSIGSKIIMSLAGDIIPFLYKVTNTDQFDENKINLPENVYVMDEIHLMKQLTKKERCKLMFVNSASALNIPGIGDETASKLFDKMYPDTDANTADFFDEDEFEDFLENILEVKPTDIEFYIGGKNGKNAKKAFEEVIKKLTLKDVIVSCCFKLCGRKAAAQCEKELLGEEHDYTSMPEVATKWASNPESEEFKRIVEILHQIGMTISDFKKIYQEHVETVSNQIPIIMTGEPNTCSTKAEFLKLHPEYRNTTSWKEVKIVFTNSLDSNTGKMKKAREKNIEIRLY